MLVIVLICGLFFVLFLFKYVNSGEDKDVSKSLFMLVCDKVDLKPYDVIIGSKKGYIKNSLLDMPNLLAPLISVNNWSPIATISFGFKLNFFKTF